MPSSCCTCAQPYDSALDSASEKPLVLGRRLDCCGRSICSRCLNQNNRYETYCPYCQITTEPSLLPQGLRDPPAYSSLDAKREREREGRQDTPQAEEELPAYSAHQAVEAPAEKQNEQPAPDVLHFVNADDSMQSLGLAYGVPLNILRKTNNLYADHLLQARRTVLIPGEYYKGGVSLSPRPVEGEEEELRKQKIRRWMVAVKVSEYDVAILYLKQAEWDLDAAIEAYREDEQWEKDHPLETKQKVKKGKSAKDAGMRRFVGR